MNKKAKRIYMRKYMRKYYHTHIKPKLDAQKSKAMKKLLSKKNKGSKVKKGVIFAAIAAIAEKEDAILFKPIKTPPPVIITDPEPPTCPDCGTLRIWKLQCPVCTRDHPHKPPSPKQSRVHIIEDGQPKEDD